MTRVENRRAGNAMSMKQIAYAAIHGRKVTFRFLRDREHIVCGYVCGADDFNIMIAVPHEDGQDVMVRLVHKSAEIIDLHAESTLDAEPPAVKVKVGNIGRSFWSLCERTYLNPDSDAESSESARPRANTGRQQRGRVLTPVPAEGALVR